MLLVAMVICGLAGMFLLAACGNGNGGGGGGEEPSPDPFNTSCFPLDIPSTDGGWCNIAFDGDGNLLIPNNNTNEVLSVDRITCILSTLATVPTGGSLYSIVYHPDMDEIFVGDTAGNIYAVNPSSGASTLLVNVSDFVNALVVAPEGYGSFGGQLLVATYSGALVAVDAAIASTTIVADAGSNISDMEFGSDGTLYAVMEDLGEVITIGADGLTSVVSSGFFAPDGIAVDNDGGRLFVSDWSADALYGVQISDGARTNLGPYDFDGGWYPSGLAYDGVGTLLMGTGEYYLTIRALTFGELLTNGGFESGDLTGWIYSALDGASTAGSILVIDSEEAPFSSVTVAGPSGGTYYAISSQHDPSTGALIQEFTVPADANTVTLTFDMFVLDLSSEGPIDAGGLSHNLGTANQHARVDILTDAAGAFDTGGTVVRNLYLDVDGYSPVLPYISYSFDLSGDVTAGETYQLRFAFTVTQNYLHMGIDNVSIIAK